MRTPTATMVGTGFGAHNGISIEGGRALKASNGIKAIVLHRTGTVMEGKMQVAELSWVPSHAAFLELETLETPRRWYPQVDHSRHSLRYRNRSEQLLARAIAIHG